MAVSFREEVEELETMPKITAVEIVDNEEEEILEVTPNTVNPDDRAELESVLKSVAPNYIRSEKPQQLIVAVHYEKSSNTYRIFGSIRKDDTKETEKIKEDMIDEISKDIREDDTESDKNEEHSE
jgi:hypothetical protein